MPRTDTQWKPGQSGNPQGRPCWLNKERQQLLEIMVKTCKESWGDFVQVLWTEALSGNLQAMRLICEYVQPKPVAMALIEEMPSLSLSHLKTDADRAQAKKIAERAQEEIRTLGGGEFNDA